MDGRDPESGVQPSLQESCCLAIFLVKAEGYLSVLLIKGHGK